MLTFLDYKTPKYYSRSSFSGNTQVSKFFSQSVQKDPTFPLKFSFSSNSERSFSFKV